MHLKLFLTFFRLGALTFGGGYAMLALLEHELVHRRPWLSSSELLEITAIAQITPGPIAVNAATFVGRRLAGLSGALTASLGVILPPLLIIGLLAAPISRWLHAPALNHLLLGLRFGVAALIGQAAFSMLRRCVTSRAGRILFATCLLILLLTPIHPLLLIALSGVTGLLLHARRRQDKHRSDGSAPGGKNP